MKKQKELIFVLILSSCFLTGCYSELMTAANLIYDRHNVYKKLSDYQLAAKASYALYHDQVFKQNNCSIELAVFNGDILLTGSVPTWEIRQTAIQRISVLTGYRRVINQIILTNYPDNPLENSWITAKIRSRIFADSEIDPHAFKVITSNHIVYLMGDVRPKEAIKVINIAKTTNGVERVVKLLKYYNLGKKALAEN